MRTPVSYFVEGSLLSDGISGKRGYKHSLLVSGKDVYSAGRKLFKRNCGHCAMILKKKKRTDKLFKKLKDQK